MSFGLGFWAAAGASSGPAGSYEQISTQILGAAAATVTFTSIPTTYKHLQVRLVCRSATTSNIDNMFFTMNGASSGYAYHRLYGTGSSVASDQSNTQSRIVLQAIATGYENTNQATPMIIDLLDYANTVTNKTIRVFHGSTNSGFTNVALHSGLLTSTAAISSILFDLQFDNIAAGSRFSLYGIKG
jgi:hypothetical protein